jgi:endonuclease/exonuclease/phosphatase family metal-dependent hydrolase
MFQRAVLTTFMLFLLLVNAMSQSATVMRTVHMRPTPDSDGPSILKVKKGAVLKLTSVNDTLGFFYASAESGESGFVFKNMLKTSTSDPDWWAGKEPKYLSACSFNIKFLGSSKSKENVKLTELLTPFDLVIVQELVAPPYAGVYPDGVAYGGDEESAAFFDLMRIKGFRHHVSYEDTGKMRNRTSSSQSEWFVVFYRPELLKLDSSRCKFISVPLVANPVFDRVPFRFQFSTLDKTLDFSVINVHLASAERAEEQRKSELETIGAHARAQSANEKDFIVVGDMNIQSLSEFQKVMPVGWVSLNNECRSTNVAAARNAENQKPYDHVVYHSEFTATDIDLEYDLQLLNIYDLFYPEWAATNSSSATSSSWVTSFGAVFSDHHPVTFRLKYGVKDDD